LLADEQFLAGMTAPNTKWAMSDHQGTIKDIVDYNPATGVASVDRHRKYDPFGDRRGAALPTDIVFGYTGKYFDEATGLQNNWNRWYDPKQGRFISQDPIGFAGGDENLYRYVGNGPTNATDPSGFFEEPPSSGWTMEPERAEILQDAIDLLKSNNLQETEVAIRTAIIRAALLHKMGFNAEYPPNPAFWTDSTEKGEYVMNKGLARNAVYNRVFNRGPWFKWTDSDGVEHTISGSSTGCSMAARLLFLEGMAYVAQQKKRLKEFDEEFSGKGMRELFPDDKSSPYHQFQGGVIDPSTLIPGDRVRMKNHMFDDVWDPVGNEGSNVIYLGADKQGRFLFLKMDGGRIVTGYELRLIVRGYSSNSDPKLENYVFVERYTPLVPSCVK
jgi:RHS repeat-associated protein